eukprot:scaffold4788_cov82-Skeletonema_menzelii.AAC.15
MSAGTASKRISEIHSRTTRRDREIAELVPKLASRSYHLVPGSSWCDDWIQYQKNTHPLFSICCHHPLHPIGRFQRVIILVGSIAFGLAITNCVYLGFLKSEQAGTAVNLIYEQAGKLSESISQLFSATSVIVLRLNADTNNVQDTTDDIIERTGLESTRFSIPILGGRPYELRKEAAEKKSDSFEDDVV